MFNGCSAELACTCRSVSCVVLVWMLSIPSSFVSAFCHIYKSCLITAVAASAAGATDVVCAIGNRRTRRLQTDLSCHSFLCRQIFEPEAIMVVI
ncbi:hypothetical protein BD289DRAFT_250428 [Coniella lustricola]|uniref:Uncharacterized protein n=1 Tax=Coniella lustricola TaxID=2025994 RepID=A0A2T3A8P4_9PEZI|nr:hypothetical protein BD289DRAFT_250428 [Coniella lustricola]